MTCASISTDVAIRAADRSIYDTKNVCATST